MTTDFHPWLVTIFPSKEDEAGQGEVECNACANQKG
eukprot:CAMPEP_0172910416 /NCGR_PEP_ID=MMETSP1075-20121228/184590_1 /TAXON_ID=2916 /ORGANISM="Ceratium fusus, Strain PA161109" /LENGTH=35 /DNA_ID= /DNA_START= /DNA_END= /DNA_ORIENTATION=